MVSVGGCFCLSIGSKESSSPSQDRPFRGPSLPAVSPPGRRGHPSGGRGHPSPATQLLSAEAGRGPKSEMKESFGPSAVGSLGPLETPGQGARITPARLLFGIHRARKSAWEKWSPAGDDITMAGVGHDKLIWDFNARLW